MTTSALGLVLLSAFLHATWNLLAKRAHGGVEFVWLFSALMTLLYAPFAFLTVWLVKPHIGLLEVAFLMGTATLHIAYYLLLNWAYQKGDLSLVYPLARGTGPMLATVGAIVLFGERPTPLALAGVACVGIGVFVFTGGFSKMNDADARPAIGYALATGVLIATYTLWDKYAVAELMIPPLLYDWSSNLLRSIALYSIARRRWPRVLHEWHVHRLEAFGVAILSALAYILVLTALSYSPVSYIAPVREISILIGAVMGSVLLSEGEIRRRWGAATIMVTGVIALALG